MDRTSPNTDGPTLMGSWGFRTFEDDIACDWLEDLYDSAPIAFFIQCLDLEGHDYLEFLACVGVVCTAEMLHGIARQPRQRLPEVAYHWCETHRDLDVQSLLPQAVEGMQRVLGSHSEMHQQWEDDADRYKTWMQHHQELIGGLRSSMAEKA
ncbi:MAG: DUF4259 domain-containing protein [Rubripirellula sp.]